MLMYLQYTLFAVSVFVRKAHTEYICTIAEIMLKLELSQPSFLTGTFAIKVLILHLEKIADLLSLTSSKIFSFS